MKQSAASTNQTSIGCWKDALIGGITRQAARPTASSTTTKRGTATDEEAAASTGGNANSNRLGASIAAEKISPTHEKPMTGL